MSIPYVDNDPTGDMTHYLNQAIMTKTRIQVSPDSRYELVVTILDSQKDKLAYKWKKGAEDIKHKDDKKGGQLIPTENRYTLLAKVEIVDKVKKTTIRGPGFISASVEYDYQHHAKRRDVTRWSLGQVEDTEADEDALPLPVFRKLSDNIALWVQQQIDLFPLKASS